MFDGNAESGSRVRLRQLLGAARGVHGHVVEIRVAHIRVVPRVEGHGERIRQIPSALGAVAGAKRAAAVAAALDARRDALSREVLALLVKLDK